MNRDTRITIAINGDTPEVCTWGEFCDDNHDDPGLIDDAREQLEKHGEYIDGGGAAPVFVLTVEKEVQG